MVACRLCAGPDAAISIFNRSLRLKAIACATIRIEPGDGLPEVVCSQCSCRLLESYRFKLKCETTDRYFRTLLSSPPKKIFNLKDEPQSVDLKSEYVDDDNVDDDEQKPNVISIQSDVEKPSVLIENNLSDNTCCTLKCSYSVDSKENDSNISRPKIENEQTRALVYETETESMKDCYPKLRVRRDSIIDAKKVEASIGDTNGAENNIVTRYMCDICGKRYKNFNGLLQHQQISHVGIRQYSCNLCKKKFTRRSHLVTHMRIHENIKPYICEICGRSFVKSSDLARHRRIHFDVKNYSCPLCNRCFKRSSDVSSHLRSHTGDRPFICKCGKSYTSHSSLKKHKNAKCSKIIKTNPDDKNSFESKEKLNI